MNLKMLARGAIAVGLILVFFTLFKGATNILNALFVPLTLFITTINCKKKDLFIIFAALMIMCIALFNMQIIFMSFYFILALILIKFDKLNLRSFLHIIILATIICIGFYISIRLTDLIFLTKIYEIMIRVLKGNLALYFSILFIESLLVSLGLFFILRLIKRKIGFLL